MSDNPPATGPTTPWATSLSPDAAVLPSVLGVFAHPDDESILAGGVLAQHAAAGSRTAVVTTTWAPDSPRAAELAEALDVLGAGAPRMLGYRDARNESSAPGRPRLCDADLDEAVANVVRHIRGFRPVAVLTHDAFGQLTGHADHRRTHQVTLLAVQAAGLAGLYPEAGDPWRTDALFAATHPASGVGELGLLLSGVGKSALSVPDRSTDDNDSPLGRAVRLGDERRGVRSPTRLGRPVGGHFRADHQSARAGPGPERRLPRHAPPAGWRRRQGRVPRARGRPRADGGARGRRRGRPRSRRRLDLRRHRRRALATPEQVAELSDWGPSATDQLAAVHRARRRLGLPEAARRPVTELTGAAAW